MPANLENTVVATDLKKSVFFPIPKKGNAKDYSSYCTVALISYARQVILKILQASPQQYMNWELPNVQTGLRTGREPDIKFPTFIEQNTREFQKNIYFCFIDCTSLDCVDHNKLWKILRQMGVPDHFNCLLKNLYAGQKATVRTRHGTTDWFKIGKGICQGCILPPCLFNLYVEYIMWNPGQDEAELESRLPGEISITADRQMLPC